MGIDKIFYSLGKLKRSFMPYLFVTFALLRFYFSRIFAVGLSLGIAVVSFPAFAHPHVWVTARAQIIFEGDKAIAIRYNWTFDEAYSQYATQGMGTNGNGQPSAQELQDLANVNVEGLHEFDFFTKAKANGKPVAFATAKDPSLEFENGALTLNFTLPIEPPMKAKQAFSIEIYDPTYFVSFIFAPEENAAQAIGRTDTCAVTIKRPKQPDFNAQEELSETFFNALTTSSTFGQDFATRATIACP